VGGNTITTLLSPGGTVGVDPGSPITAPTVFALAQPRPNPFDSRVALDFALPVAAPVRLEIYDVQGHRIRTLENGVLAPGHYARTWDGANASGEAARAGVYFVRFAAPGVQLTRKALLVR